MKKYIARNFYVLIALYAAALFLSNDMFLPAIGSIANGFHVSRSTVSFGVGAFLLGTVLFQLFAGILSEKLGYKRALVISGFIFAFLDILVVFSPNIETFLFIRLLQGAGTCMFSAAGIAAVNEYYEDDKAILALSLTVNIILISPILGPIIGAAVLSFFNWQAIFEINIVYVVIIVLLLWYGMPDVQPRIEQTKVESFLGNFRGTISAAKNKSFVLQCLSIGFFGGTFLTWITIAPHMLMDNLHLTVDEYSYWQIPVLGAFLVGNTIAPVLANRFPPRRVVYLTMNAVIIYVIIAIIGMLAISFIPEQQPKMVAILLVLIPLGGLFFIRGINNAPHEQYTLALQREYQGSSASVLSFINLGIGTVASLAASKLYGLTNAQYEYIMLVFAGLSAIVFLISRRIEQKQKGEIK